MGDVPLGDEFKTLELSFCAKEDEIKRAIDEGTCGHQGLSIFNTSLRWYSSKAQCNTFVGQEKIR